MKLLLTAINARYIHSNPALPTLAASVPDCRGHLFLKEYTVNQPADFILRELYTAAPDVLFFSCYIWNITYVEILSAELHKLLPELPIWLGGPEVSFEPEAFLTAHPAVTGIMCGEGEDSFSSLARHYLYGSPEYFSDIPGLAFRQNGTFTHTGEPLRLPLSRIPFACGDLSAPGQRIIYYESARGCPFRCTYCLSSVEKSLRFRDFDLVKDELSFFVAQGVPQVKFVDRTFNCNHSHALAIWRHIREIDCGTTNFHFEVSADLFREDELALLERFRPGLIQLEIGVQSTNPATIAEIRRQTDLKRLMHVVRRIRAWNNIHLHLDLIAGLPFEDYETFAKSFDDVFALIPHQLQLGFLKVLKGSYMYEHAQEYGILYHDGPPYEVLATKWLGYGDLLRIKRVCEMVEVYYNSAQYALSVRLLTLCYPGAFAFFQRLGDYYEKNGLFACSHSRLARCEILLAFVQEELCHGAGASGQPLDAPGAPASDLDLDMLKEALVYDLYARENCKKRPAWAADLTPQKEVLRSLGTQKGSAEHIEIFHYRFPAEDAQALDAVPKRCPHALFYRFCYDRRDPLTHQAFIKELQPPEKQ